MSQGLLTDCPTGGCGAKIDPALLSGFLKNLPPQAAARLLVGFETSDDAAVWKLSEEEALISTADFFPPMVDDAFLFGQIAAVNALSDIYAMGGRPILALNLVCFPEKKDPAVLAEILAGGADILQKAGAFLAGGHSIYDPIPKYGLAVTGLVHPQKLRRNCTVQPGDALILTKPLGTGLILNARRVSQAREEDYQAAVQSMLRLNREASLAMNDFPVSAATDVTGFGLLGHLNEMAGSRYTFYINFESLPLLPGALDYAREFLSTALGQRNRRHLEGRLDLEALGPAESEIVFDPQTSGGLMMTVPAGQAQKLLDTLRRTCPEAAIIGQAELRVPGGPAAAVV